MCYLSRLIALLASPWVVQAADVSVADFNAPADGTASATAAIQTAIDRCAAADGGIVRLPAGRYRSGTLHMRNGVNLHLEKNAVLFASPDPADFPKDHPRAIPALIYGEKLKKISITGEGTIDGRARHQWVEETSPDPFIARETELARRAGIPLRRARTLEPKISLVSLKQCSDIRMEGISILRSPHWSVHLAACHDVTLANLRVETSLKSGVNADGIDIDGCSNVRVHDCTILTGDDAICLKSTRDGSGAAPCENILIERCTLTSTSSALKLGTESHGDFRNITFSECRILDSNRGLAIILRDGATIRDVSFSNITIECTRKPWFWWGDGDPIHIVVKPRTPESPHGRIDNIRFENITATGQGTSLIAGLPDHPLGSITFDNVTLTLAAEATPDKRATDILSIRDAENVTLHKVRLNWDTSQGVEPAWDKALRTERIAHLQEKDSHYQLKPKPTTP